MVKVNGSVIAKQDGAFDNIAQLADVPWPAVINQCFHCTWGDVGDVSTHPEIKLTQEEAYQFGNILTPFL